MSNPLDDYFKEKTAFFGSGNKGQLGKTFGDIAGSTAVQFGVAAGLTAIGPVAQKITSAVTKRRSYSNMLEQNPDLQDFREDNPKQFNNMYNSFHRINPEFASDPIVSGTYMRQMAAHPEGAGKVIVESLKGREGLGSPFGDALRSGSNAASKGFSGAFAGASKP